MAAIREPHLEIEFETPPAVIVEETPDLVTCIVARANQVVEVQNSDGTANVSAVTDVPAALLFLGPWATPLHDADAISLRVDNGPVHNLLAFPSLRSVITIRREPHLLWRVTQKLCGNDHQDRRCGRQCQIGPPPAQGQDKHLNKGRHEKALPPSCLGDADGSGPASCKPF